jgi:hypothetical protein
MALVLKDRVKEQTTTTGTGTVTLGGAVSGFEAFSAVGDGNTTYYAIVHQTADEWEVGLGTYTAAGTLLSRDTILESTNSDAAVNFSAGTKDVFVTYPSDKAIYEDAAGGVDINGGTIDGTVIGGASAAAGTFTTGLFNTSLKIGTTGVNGDLALARSSDGATIATFKTDGTNGVINSVIDTVFQINTTEVGRIGTTGFSTANAAGPTLLNEAATAGNATVVQNRANPELGLGWAGTNIGTLVANNSEVARWDTTNGITVAALKDVNLSGRVNVSNITNINTQGYRLADGTSSILTMLSQHSTGAFRIQQYDGVSAWNNRLAIDTDGNVGIGTTASDGKLDIATGGTTDVVAALGGTFPAFTYRNGTGTWFHAGKHPSSDYFYIGHGATPTTNVDVVVDSSGNLQMANAAGPSLLQEAATSTNPTIIPNKADPDTGMGWVSANVGALIAGGTKNISWDNTHVGLNGMTPNAPAQGNFSVTMGGIGSTGSGLLQIVGNAAGAYRNAGVHFVGYDGGSYSENAVIEQHYTTGTASGSLVFKTKAQAGSLTTALTLGDDQNATFAGDVSAAGDMFMRLTAMAVQSQRGSTLTQRTDTRQAFDFF